MAGGRGDKGNARLRAGGSPRRTHAPSEVGASRGETGNLLREGMMGISIVAAAALVAAGIGATLAIVIALLY